MKHIVSIWMAMLFGLFAAVPAAAFSYSRSTSHTLAMTINGEKEVAQDAYLPGTMYLDLGLNAAQDLYLRNDCLYIADTDNKRVLAVDLSTGEVLVIGEGILGEPTGVSADGHGNIYVADSGNGAAYRFLPDGSLDFVFERPEVPSFGKKTGYKPVKIAPAEAGGVYIVSEGTLAGIIHISGQGNFLGFFASNDVQMSLFDKLVNILLTEEQQKNFLKKTPPSFGNIFRGEDGLVYTINKGKDSKIKKHSISGLDMFSKSEQLPAVDTPTDLFVTGEGRIFLADYTGRVTEITSDGYFLCSFGAAADGDDRAGLFDQISGIAVDGQENVYILDREKNHITVFEAAPVQKDIHQAINYYQMGNYDESQALLDDVLRLNGTSYFAHIYSGKNYMQKAEYDRAEYHFKTAGSRTDYSNAYWEVRNLWLQDNLVYILLVLITAVILFWLVGLLKRKTNLFMPLAKRMAALKRNRFVFDMTQIKYAMLHPIDNAYEIKTGRTGTYGSAVFIYSALLLILVLYQVGTGFIFSQYSEEYSFLNTAVLYISAVLLFLIVHNLISSVNDGLGTMRSIAITIAYSFTPMLVFMPFVILFANIATINEGFFIQTAILCLFVWSICNAVAGLIEIHDYKLKTMVGNIFVTAFAMGVSVLAASVGYLLLKQIIDFIYEIIVEVGLRV